MTARHALSLLIALSTIAAATQSAQAYVYTGYDARFIRFVKTDGTVNPGDSNNFHIAEIEAFLHGVTPGAGLDGLNDLALSGKGASATTIAGAVSHGADGNLISGVVNTGAATWTRNDTVGPVSIIGQVDLGGTFEIGTIRAWQRGDGCCQSRLQSFDVQLLADDGFGAPGEILAALNFPGQVPSSSFQAFEFSQFVVPEPSTALLLLTGLLGLTIRRNRSGRRWMIGRNWWTARFKAEAAYGRDDAGTSLANSTSAHQSEIRFADSKGEEAIAMTARNTLIASLAALIVVGTLVETADAAIARFVRVSKTAGSTDFHLGELEAFAFGVTPNNAGGGSVGGLTTSTNDIGDLLATVHAGTTTSSLAHGGANTNPDNVTQNAGNVWSTNVGLSSPDPRYTLDLGSTMNIGTVRAWPRADTCCTGRWSNLTLELFADDGTGNPGAQVDSFVIGTPGGNTPQSISFGTSLANATQNGKAVATQSTTLSNPQNPTASKAIDGNTDSVFNNGSITHTDGTDPNAFWEVDLGSRYSLSLIELFNREEGLSSRLSNFRLSVFDDATETYGENFYTSGGSVAGEQGFLLPAGVSGDRVRVQLLGPNTNGDLVLSLAEVNAYGAVIPEPSTGLLLIAGLMGLATRRKSRASSV